MSFHVYILRCADNSYYVGQTDVLTKRLAEHEPGKECGILWPRQGTRSVSYRK